MFGELALKFIHTSAEHVSEIQMILKEFWCKFLPKGKIKWMGDKQLCRWQRTRTMQMDAHDKQLL
jgi:hypothetical protein